MTKHITIHAPDTDAEARARHARIEARLNELGEPEVRRLSATGGLAPQWEPIVRAWLNGERLEPAT